jgi:hypothetical protein
MKYGSNEWYLYHDKKNEEPVIPLIVISFFVFFIKLGVFYVILIWVMYFSWAKENNKKLDNDPEIIKHRMIYDKLRKEGKIQ